MATLTLNLPMERIADLCRAHRVRELSVFGSVLRDDFRPSSDVDMLVLFEPDATIGFLELAALQYALEDVVNRPVDLVSKQGLNRVIRQQILDNAQVIYGAE
ncbi:MAG: nucleotidyltransferase domain-containing protein [Propionibacteriaceae bacterium]|nr:nucleotidyltransferase domain-containing protein [Propionibacteriaceae bacterium]